MSKQKRNLLMAVNESQFSIIIIFIHCIVHNHSHHLNFSLEGVGWVPQKTKCLLNFFLKVVLEQVLLIVSLSKFFKYFLTLFNCNNSNLVCIKMKRQVRALEVFQGVLMFIHNHLTKLDFGNQHNIIIFTLYHFRILCF